MVRACSFWKGYSDGFVTLGLRVLVTVFPLSPLLVNFELQNIFIIHYFLLKLPRVDFVACNKKILAEICLSLEHRSELHLYSLQNNQHNFF